jgi:hypothetical protein
MAHPPARGVTSFCRNNKIELKTGVYIECTILFMPTTAQRFMLVLFLPSVSADTASHNQELAPISPRSMQSILEWQDVYTLHSQSQI